MAKRQRTLFNIWYLPDKKRKEKKMKKKEEELVDLHDERVKYVGHFNV